MHNYHWIRRYRHHTAQEKRNACARCLVLKIRCFSAKFRIRYRPKPFTSSAIENKVKKGALRFCAHSNLWLLSFNNPEYRPLRAYLNIEMNSSTFCLFKSHNPETFMSSAASAFVHATRKHSQKVPRAKSGVFWFPWMDSHDSSTIQLLLCCSTI